MVAALCSVPLGLVWAVSEGWVYYAASYAAVGPYALVTLLVTLPRLNRLHRRAQSFREAHDRQTGHSP